MLYFLEKNGKIAAALGALPPKPRWLAAAGGSAPRPPSCYLQYLFNYFEIKIYYLILEWRLVGSLAKLAPPPLPAQISRYATAFLGRYSASPLQYS